MQWAMSLFCGETNDAWCLLHEGGSDEGRTVSAVCNAAWVRVSVQ